MRVRAVEPADCLIRENEMLLLYEESFVRLGALGAAIVESATNPVTLGELADSLVARFGDPPDADASSLVSAALEDLVQQGVLRVMDT